MTGKRHSPELIIRKLLRTAGQLPNQGESLADFVSSWGSAPTCYRWLQLYGEMKATEAKRLKELEQENVRHMRLLADAELDKAMLLPQARLSRRS